VNEGYPEQPAEQSGSPEPVNGDEPVDRDEPVAADPRVGAAVRRLDELTGRPLAEQVEVYESVHRSLQESLAEAAGDEQPARSQPADPPGPHR
jgi:hypothetical protein